MKENQLTRFELNKVVGEGSFSKIFLAYDHKLQMKVALKIEKEDKNKNILLNEYEILNRIQGLKRVPRAYGFIQSCEDLKELKNTSFIIMELLGKNLAIYKKNKIGNNLILAYEILTQMLDAIEDLHERGFIHRDIKPANFVMGLKENKHRLYMVDFGLAKEHLNKMGKPFSARKVSDFRGTITYASLNAHYKIVKL